MNIRYLFVLLLSSLFMYGCPSMGPVSDQTPPELSQQLSSLIQYPEVSSDAGEEGQVIVQAKVLKDGSTAEVKVIQSSGYPVLDAEAVRVTKLVKFKPVVDDSDKTVNSWVRIPFRFRLDE